MPTVAPPEETLASEGVGRPFLFPRIRARAAEARDALFAVLVESYSDRISEQDYIERVRRNVRAKYGETPWADFILALFDKMIAALPSILEFIAGLVKVL